MIVKGSIIDQLIIALPFKSSKFNDYTLCNYLFIFDKIQK